jgi:hypothetical protein
MEEGMAYSSLIAYPISIKPIGATNSGSTIYPSMLAFTNQLNEIFHSELQLTTRVQSLAECWYATYKYVNGIHSTHSSNSAPQLQALAELGITPLSSDAASIINWITTEAADPYEVMDSIETAIATANDMDQFLTDTGWCPIVQDPISLITINRPLRNLDIVPNMHPSFGSMREDLTATRRGSESVFSIIDTPAISQAYWKSSSWLRTLVEVMIWYPYVNVCFNYNEYNRDMSFEPKCPKMYEQALIHNLSAKQLSGEIVSILPMMLREKLLKQ